MWHSNLADVAADLWWRRRRASGAVECGDVGRAASEVEEDLVAVVLASDQVVEAEVRVDPARIGAALIQIRAGIATELWVLVGVSATVDVGRANCILEGGGICDAASVRSTVPLDVIGLVRNQRAMPAADEFAAWRGATCRG